MKKLKRDFLTLKDFSGEEIKEIIRLSSEIKKDGKKFSKILEGKNFAMLFDKHSTRTRLSFEAGIAQMGGNCIYLDKETLQIKRGETIEDSARIFSGYLDGLIIRTYAQETVELFAKNSSIPIINGLTDKYHPCQIISDLFTIHELSLLTESLKFTYVGDCNNVLNSLLIGFVKLGIDITVGCSKKYGPDAGLMNYLMIETKKTGSKIKVVNDALEAVKGADIIYTDVWVSMGDEGSHDKISELSSFQINKGLLSHAIPEVKIMHCLPAHRGQEITSEVMDGQNSIVFLQAENRLYAQKALLAFLFSDQL